MFYGYCYIFPSKLPIPRLFTVEFLQRTAVEVVEILKHPSETTNFHLKGSSKNTDTIYDLVDTSQ